MEKKEFAFNANQYVKVKLTDLGVKILKDNHNELRRAFPMIPEFELKLDDKGYYQTQLWRLMEDFGMYVGITKEKPFHLDMIFITE